MLIELALEGGTKENRRYTRYKRIAGVLVFHPDIFDAMAVLDAAADEEGDVVIAGFGDKVDYRSVGFDEIVYYLCEGWKQS